MDALEHWEEKIADIFGIILQENDMVCVPYHKSYRAGACGNPELIVGVYSKGKVHYIDNGKLRFIRLSSRKCLKNRQFLIVDSDSIKMIEYEYKLLGMLAKQKQKQKQDKRMGCNGES